MIKIFEIVIEFFKQVVGRYLFSSLPLMISFLILMFGIGTYLLSKIKEMMRSKARRNLKDELREYLQEEKR